MTDRRGAAFGDVLGRIERHAIAARSPSVRGPLARVMAVLGLARAVMQAARVLRRIRPAAAVGFGGYPSVPPLVASGRLGIPSVLHEQNAVLGRANRMLARRASAIATSFPETERIPRHRAALVTHVGDESRAMAWDALGLGEGRGDRRCTAGQHPVGAAEHRVLLVQHAGNAEPPARHQRRHRRVAAEAHSGGRANPAKHARRLHDRTRQTEHGHDARQGPAHARAAGRNGVSFDAPEYVAEGGAPPIRHENKTTATCFQLCREGLCRKHMAASSACCEENGRVGRRRSQST